MAKKHEQLLYRIYKIERLYAYISKLDLVRTSYGDIHTRIIFSNISNKKEITSMYFKYNCYNDYIKEYEMQELLPFYAFHVDLGNENYYRIDWDDINLGKYDKRNLFEIAREEDSNGEERPLCIRNYVVYAYYEPDVNLEQFKNNSETELVDILLSNLEDYEKRHFYIPFKKETRELLKYRNDYINIQRLRNQTTNLDEDIYEAFDPNSDDCNRASYNDMTDEERIMRDLEEGKGEIHGY